MTSTISVAGLTRRYSHQLGLDDVTFDVVDPSITRLLGRNGAGSDPAAYPRRPGARLGWQHGEGS